MLTKEQKQQTIEELADKIKRQKVLVFTDFRGLKVEELQNLRAKLREENVEYRVAKKTLIKLALKKAKKEVDISKFDAPMALALGYEDPVMPAKIIDKFAKGHKNLGILGGLMGDKFLTVEEVQELASIPSKEELLAKLVGSLKSPISGFVNVLRGSIRNLLLIFKQITES